MSKSASASLAAICVLRNALTLKILVVCLVEPYVHTRFSCWANNNKIASSS